MTQCKLHLDRRGYIGSYILLVLFFFGAPACGAQDLSEQKAKKLIEESDRLARYSTNVPLSTEGSRKGEQHGLWNYRRSELTSRGQGYFSALRNGYVTVKNPVTPPAILINGITGEGEYRDVSFNWMYWLLGPPVQYYAVQGGHGVAHFRRYDDGWRLSDNTGTGLGHTVEFTIDRTKPYSLGAEGQAQEQAQVKAWEEQERLAEEEREHRRRLVGWKGNIFGTWGSRGIQRDHISLASLPGGSNRFTYKWYDYNTEKYNETILTWNSDTACEWLVVDEITRDGLDRGTCELTEQDKMYGRLTRYVFRTTNTVTGEKMKLEFTPVTTIAEETEEETQEDAWQIEKRQAEAKLMERTKSMPPESREPTRQIRQFRVYSKPLSSAWESGDPFYLATLTDVNIQYRWWPTADSNPEEVTMWFGDIVGIGGRSEDIPGGGSMPHVTIMTWNDVHHKIYATEALRDILHATLSAAWSAWWKKYD